MVTPPLPGATPTSSSSRRGGISSSDEDGSPAFSAAADGGSGADDGRGELAGRSSAVTLPTTAEAMTIAAHSGRVSRPVSGLGPKPFVPEQDGRNETPTGDTAGLSGGRAATGLSGGEDEEQSVHHL